MGYTLITANRNYSSWSLRPWLLLRALEIPFEDRLEPFTQAVNYDAFRAFSPTGQVPVLLDGDRTVWDSLGIVLYLAERHPGVWPDDAAARGWAQCATAEMHGGFGGVRNAYTMNVGVRVSPPRPDPGARPRDRQARRTLGRGARSLRRAVACRPDVQRGRCLFRAGRVSSAHLWPRCRRRGRCVGRAHPGASGNARMGNRRAHRKLARGGA